MMVVCLSEFTCEIAFVCVPMSNLALDLARNILSKF